MQYGIVLPTTGPGGDARTIADLAHDAEEAGWDGVFIWDCMFIKRDKPEDEATYDPWIALAAIAMRTARVRIGTMITPLSRRRPWKVARETVTLDHLSHGRMILPVGLGTLDDGGFSKVGEVTDRKQRAHILDESLDILTGLWSGQPFSYEGTHYQVQEMTFTPPPVQSPRIPIWVVGAWPRMQSMQRTLRYDGIIPARMHPDGSFADTTPADIQSLKSYVTKQRSQQTPFDIIIEGETSGDDLEKAMTIVQPYIEAGITWWLESVWSTPETQGGAAGMRTRIKQGPPR
ncbi:MAG TPA: LLM class flavin-dependent oxidoreductase [Ktedonobacteraceae bacterium]|nr:LLM class flavin-dependent oxidoreductase [Ktedonobacteraceae bacterium]